MKQKEITNATLCIVNAERGTDTAVEVRAQRIAHPPATTA